MDCYWLAWFMCWSLWCPAGTDSGQVPSTHITKRYSPPPPPPPAAGSVLTVWSTGNAVPYMSSFSRKMIGSGSLMAAFNRPRASSLSYGANTWGGGGGRERDKGVCMRCGVCMNGSMLPQKLTQGSWIKGWGEAQARASSLPYGANTWRQGGKGAEEVACQ